MLVISIIGIILIIFGSINLKNWDINPLGFMSIVIGIGLITIGMMNTVDEKNEKIYSSYIIVDIIDSDIFVESDQNTIIKFKISNFRNSEIDILANKGDTIKLIDMVFNDELQLYKEYDEKLVLVKREQFLGGIH